MCTHQNTQEHCVHISIGHRWSSKWSHSDTPRNSFKKGYVMIYEPISSEFFLSKFKIIVTDYGMLMTIYFFYKLHQSLCEMCPVSDGYCHIKHQVALESQLISSGMSYEKSHLLEVHQKLSLHFWMKSFHMKLNMQCNMLQITNSFGRSFFPKTIFFVENYLINAYLFSTKCLR